jgi:hypothetical protein
MTMRRSRNPSLLASAEGAPGSQEDAEKAVDSLVDRLIYARILSEVVGNLVNACMLSEEEAKELCGDLVRMVAEGRAEGEED